ncbi:hypothetical protein D3C78_1519000 [compost metagenome]
MPCWSLTVCCRELTFFPRSCFFVCSLDNLNWDFTYAPDIRSAAAVPRTIDVIFRIFRLLGSFTKAPAMAVPTDTPPVIIMAILRILAKGK